MSLNSKSRRIIEVTIDGEIGVGKTQLILRWAHNAFTQHYISSIGVDCYILNFDSKKRNYRYEIWDRASLAVESLRNSHSAAYYGRSDICIIVYDITNRSSFHMAAKRYEEIKRYCKENTLLVLVGNKCDQQERRQVKWEQGQALAYLINGYFLQASAKDAVNIQKVFTGVLDSLQ